MFLNIEKALFFVLMVCSEVYSLPFDQFKNELSMSERNEIASRCIMESFKNEEKIIDTAIHTAKGQHIKSEKEVCDAPVIPLCIPIKCEPSFLNFVRDFYLLFDKSVERKGAVTKLNDLLQMNSIRVKDIDVVLQIISRTFSTSVSYNTHHLNILKLSSDIRKVITILSCVPTSIQMLKFLPQRLESAKKADVQETDSHFIAIKEIDTNGEGDKVVARLDALREEFIREIKEKALSLVGILERAKGELDPQIREKLLEDVVPSMHSAAQLFVYNSISDGSGKEVKISSEDMSSILDTTRGKPQVVSTRKYNPASYKRYMEACVVHSELKGKLPSNDVTVKAVVSKESELVYLSTFFPELSLEK